MLRLKFPLFALFFLSVFLTPALLLGKQQDVSENQDAFSAEDAEFGEVFVLAIGGKLYDNIWTMTAINPPEKPNPAFPADIDVSASETWRCVSCHGWDYKGKDGERSKMGMPDAFANLKHIEGTELETVTKRIREAHPEYPNELFDDAILEVLALFVSIGQYNRDAFLTSDGIALGKVENGRAIFEGACMNCHQYDGKATLIGELGDKSSLGWISRNRPEQALHKVMNGVPGTDMLAIRFLTERQIGDLFAFLQTLDPNEK
ncbi:MAG: c-type cytochrome [Hyphomicrobiales bacterium]